MYPLLRFARVLRDARRAGPLGPDATDEISLLCYPWDVDVFIELNNGRALTLYDLGRFHFSARVGLVGLLRRNKWQFAVAGASIRYRYRVKAFDRITMRTRVAGVEGRWIYMEQSMWVRGRAVSGLLVRTAVTDASGAVSAARVAEALGKPDWAPALAGWGQAWAAADGQRPWPPE